MQLVAEDSTSGRMSANSAWKLHCDSFLGSLGFRHMVLSLSTYPSLVLTPRVIRYSLKRPRGLISGYVKLRTLFL